MFKSNISKECNKGVIKGIIGYNKLESGIV